jgi:hypothetical protein
MLADGELLLEAHVLGEKPPGAVGYCIGMHRQPIKRRRDLTTRRLGIAMDVPDPRKRLAPAEVTSGRHSDGGYDDSCESNDDR